MALLEAKRYILVKPAPYDANTSSYLADSYDIGRDQMQKIELAIREQSLVGR